MFAVRVPSIKSTHIKPFTNNWEQLKTELLKHEERADKYAGALYSPVTYAEGAKRGNAGVQQVNALVIDLDGESLQQTLSSISDYEYVAYTTFSHRADDPHWHLVLPLSHSVPKQSWRGAWLNAHQRIGLRGDPQTKDPARIFFLPQHALNMPYQTLCNSGRFFVPYCGAPSEPVSSKKSADAARFPKSFWSQSSDMTWCEGLTTKEAMRVALERFQKLRM